VLVPALVLGLTFAADAQNAGLASADLPAPQQPACRRRARRTAPGVDRARPAAGEFFGDRRLDEVVQANQSNPPAELLDRLLSEIRMWRSASVPPQDDITIIIADVDVPAEEAAA
jgi:hypothetical protein